MSTHLVVRREPCWKDVIVTCSSHPDGCWALATYPHRTQLRAPPDEALTMAADFAFATKVDVWLRDGDTSCIIERNRPLAGHTHTHGPSVQRPSAANPA